MSRNKPMTFFRQVPILLPHLSCREAMTFPGHTPSQHVALFGVLQNQHQLVDTVNFVFDALNQGAKRIGDIIDEGVGDPI